MPKIQQLDAHVADLIAAGEVVERPASAVKELVENSIDAGASSITVEIRDGGMTFIRITDDGCGMESADARIAFLRHATSKLRTKDDLAAIGTLGFRGEALAAISSVSKIDLLTKTRESAAGTALYLEAGVIRSEEPAGCADGTTILVRDLFYNTPARMKFMKSDMAEASAVFAAVQREALARRRAAAHLRRRRPQGRDLSDPRAAARERHGPRREPVGENLRQRFRHKADRDARQPQLPVFLRQRPLHQVAHAERRRGGGL